MSMGYSANMLMTITMEDVKKLNLSSFEILNQFMQDTNATWENLAELFIWDTPIEELTVDEQKEIEDLYKSFKKEFKETTGITINLEQHNSEDEGSRYDDVDGVFFQLDFFDVFDYTPEAKALKEKVDIHFSNYVSFG